MSKDMIMMMEDMDMPMTMTKDMDMANEEEKKPKSPSIEPIEWEEEEGSPDAHPLAYLSCS
jgi:hypothetical protein